ncbi:MAG: AAA family ATPase [Thermoleophilia bacterium]
MDVFKGIIDWAQTLPIWEQEAVHRLVVCGQITEEDEQELIELLKSTDAARAKPPEIVTPQPAGGSVVSLVSLEHICGVNALAPGQTLTFKELTVLYGDNGSGKSGYSRILKHACRSREKKLPVILSDVFCSTTPPVAHAKFTFVADGTQDDEGWTVSTQSSEALGSIAIFDSGCSRSYVEEDGDPAYRPYGLEVFEELGKICGKLKMRLNGEATSIQDSKLASQFSELTTVAVVSDVLLDNSEKNTERLIALANLSDEETKKASALQTRIARLETEDPQKLANSCRKLATRLESSVLSITSAATKTKEQLALAADALKNRDATTKLAAEASAIAFGEEPVQGVGTDQWKLMFQYARAFSTEAAYPNEEFPFVGEDAKCVLCHQALAKDAKLRMARFAEFVGNKAQENARTAEENYQKVRAAAVDASKEIVAIDDALIEQVESHDEAAAKELRSARTKFAVLQKSAAEVVTDEQWKNLSAPPVDTQRQTQLAAKLRTEAADFERNSNADERAKLKQELSLLRERQQLKKLFPSITEAAKLAAEKRRLNDLAARIDTRHITLKAGEITRKVLTTELCAALNDELKALEARDLEVEFAPKGGVGSQPHYLRFKKAPKGDLKNVLSEGEHRCLGIAAFLAELGQGGHRSAIVLDDPVSSLDQEHREAVATRLVKEAKNRQVVIFTHDLAFLYALERAAGEQRVPLHRQAVQRTPAGAGVVSRGVYPEEMKLPEFIAFIREQASEIASLAPHDPGRPGKVAHLYSQIRTAWELVVEKTLLRMVVSPFTKAVQTQQLKGVLVEDDDYHTVFWAMKRASDHTDAHRTPAGAQASIPSNEQIARDIEELDQFRKTVKKRGNDLADERKKLEEPPTA